jgi:hypothetical protein
MREDYEQIKSKFPELFLEDKELAKEGGMSGAGRDKRVKIAVGGNRRSGSRSVRGSTDSWDLIKALGL